MNPTKFIAICGLVLIASFSQLRAAGKEPTMADNIVVFCQQHLGEKVGDGECSSLADHALSENGAKGRTADNPNKGDYVWGEPVFHLDAGQKPEGKLADIQPGDIIQFRDVKFAGKRAGGGTYSMTFGHHTAIVAAAADAGGTVKIFQQNYAGKRVAMDGVLHLGDLKEGWLRFYRPELKKGR